MKNELVIGKFHIPIPVFQGGMGVGVSLSRLAGAVAAAGGVGVISAAQIGFRDPDYLKNPLKCNLKALAEEIQKAKEIAKGGIVGVNIMVVTQGYDEYVKTAVEAGADILISGAGLPMTLPKLAQGSNSALIPIISSKSAASVILKYWKKKYDRYPDALIVEGPKAGGHLGFRKEQLETIYANGDKEDHFQGEIKEIIGYLKEVEEQDKVSIPLIVAGGVFEGKDLAHYKEMGAAGVQLGSRFVTTVECDAAPQYKQAYLDAKEEDIVLVDSPVGLPGRAIKNEFLKRVKQGEKFMRGCKQCIATCKPKESPYCIAEALIQAVKGNVKEGLLFCGSNTYRLNKLESVKEIMEEFALWQ